MRTVWKFDITPLKSESGQSIYMPKDATVRSVNKQGNALCLWAEVNVDKDVAPELEIRTFLFFGTGVDIDQDATEYIGTIYGNDTFGAPLVFHVYEQDDGSYKGDGDLG